MQHNTHPRPARGPHAPHPRGLQRHRFSLKRYIVSVEEKLLQIKFVW
jgi:hypothetical protein